MFLCFYGGTPMFTIAVCDDNLPFAHALAQKLRYLCAHYVPDRIDCQIAPEFGSADEVLQYLSEFPIDVLFLDIHMPQTNGFQLAGVLNEKYPDTTIIFVSAHNNLVYKSFEFSPFRFLRKDHLEEELPSAVQKVIEKCITNNETFLFQTTKGEILLRVKDILYFESEKNYYTVHCVSGAAYHCRGTISSVEEATNKFNFFRIHSAYIINEEHVEHIDDKKEIVHMKNGVVLNISRKKISHFKNSYMDFIRRRFIK